VLVTKTGFMTQYAQMTQNAPSPAITQPTGWLNTRHDLINAITSIFVNSLIVNVKAEQSPNQLLVWRGELQVESTLDGLKDKNPYIGFQGSANVGPVVSSSVTLTTRWLKLPEDELNQKLYGFYDPSIKQQNVRSLQDWANKIYTLSKDALDTLFVEKAWTYE